MRCPSCGAGDTRVVDSRDLDEAGAIRRRRECPACSTRFTTYERVEAARLVVVKRDGRREEFDRGKLVAGFRKSLARRPVPKDAPERAADEIEALLRSQGVSEIPSRRIGQLSMERLRELDEIAYLRFALVFQTYRDLGQVKREFDTLMEERAEPSPGQTQLALELEAEASAASSARLPARRSRTSTSRRAAPAPAARAARRPAAGSPAPSTATPASASAPAALGTDSTRPRS